MPLRSIPTDRIGSLPGGSSYFRRHRYSSTVWPSMAEAAQRESGGDRYEQHQDHDWDEAKPLGGRVEPSSPVVNHSGRLPPILLVPLRRDESSVGNVPIAEIRRQHRRA
jgi:hypothetical protein